LTFDKHIGDLIYSCMAKLCQINRIKHCFDRNTLTNIISTLVLSMLYYSVLLFRLGQPVYPIPVLKAIF
jgi:hypothetical protein